MARGEIILRQWNMLKMLQTRGEGMPLRDLADEFEVSERTIQRDFETLQEVGFPIEFEEDECGKRYWRMPHDFFKSGPLMISLTEAVSLHLAEKMFAPLAGTYLAEGLETILDKIRNLMPTKALDYFANLDEIVHVRRVGVTDYSAHAETIRAITEAMRSERSVEVQYRSVWSGQEYVTIFDPYGLVIFDSDLFLVGRSHRAEDMRIFKVTRIRSLSQTNARFGRPGGFSLAEHFRSSFGIIQSNAKETEVVARFTGVAAALVEERIWHESQQLAWLDSEATLFDEAPNEPQALVATFRLSNLIEFKRWIKGFGDQAEILTPDWLREEFHAELVAATKLYEG